MNGFGLSRERFALLFSVMLVAAAGNTAMQSLLPAIGRELGVADIWVAVAFSLSAVVWVVMAPVWAHRADRRGRRALMRLGLVRLHRLDADLRRRARRSASPGWSAPMLVFTIFMLGRDLLRRVRLGLAARGPGLYRRAHRGRRSGPTRWPCSPPPSGSARSSARRSRRLFIFPPLGLSAPLIVFAGIGAIVLAADRAAAARRHARRTRRAGRSSPIPRSAAAAPAQAARADGRVAAALARSARPALAHHRHRRRPRPGGPARRDRLPRHRPARAAARARPSNGSRSC